MTNKDRHTCCCK